MLREVDNQVKFDVDNFKKRLVFCQSISYVPIIRKGRD